MSLNFYAEYIMWNAQLDESQAGIKIDGRSINNLRYANNTILMAESEDEFKEPEDAILANLLSPYPGKNWK